jgi:hypothetical protein
VDNDVTYKRECVCGIGRSYLGNLEGKRNEYKCKDKCVPMPFASACACRELAQERSKSQLLMMNPVEFAGSSLHKGSISLLWYRMSYAFLLLGYSTIDAYYSQ